MPTRADLIQAPPDGNRIFMVAIELCCFLFALVYAFPHIPSALVDEIGAKKRTFEWHSVETTAGLLNAIRMLLDSSDVLEASRLAVNGRPARDLLAIVAKVDALADYLSLGLDEPNVPVNARLIIETVCSAYRWLNTYPDDFSTRESIIKLLRAHQLIPVSFELEKSKSESRVRSQSALIEFCSGHALRWIQPFYAHNPKFFVPPPLAAGTFVNF